MTATKHLIDGRIPAGTACPWAEPCALRQDRCPTVDHLRDVPFSCARARFAELSGFETDEERQRAAGG